MQKKLKIQLIQLSSPREDWLLPSIPLGLMSIGATLKQAYPGRVEVKLLDLGIEPAGFGRDDRIRHTIESFMPDLVGIRGLTCQEAEFHASAKIVREVNPHCVIIAGGPHANAEPAELLGNRAINCVGLGEGEETMREIAGRILAHKDFRTTPGLAYRENGSVRFSAPREPIQCLDTLPFPDYSLIDLAPYQRMTTMTTFFARSRYTTLFTSRGCPHQCIYCHNIFGKKVRLRSARHIFDEMVHLHKKHGISEFHVVDDIFNVDKARALETFKLIARSPYRFRLAFPNGLRADGMNREMIRWARAAGTYHIAYAVESASPRIQRMIRKYSNLRKLSETLAWTVKEGIFTSTFNMIGFPTETEEEMAGTIDYALNSPVHMAIFFLVTPFRGTELFKLAVKHGFEPMKGGEHLRYHNIVDEAVPWFTEVPRKKIKGLLYDFNRHFYFDHLRLERIMRVIPRTHGWDQIGQFLYNRMTELGLSIDKIPDRKARHLLWRIMKKARKAAPETCRLLPVPPEREKAPQQTVLKLRIQRPSFKVSPVKIRRGAPPPPRASRRAILR
jgi:radical SAM superfamily enzyme YgiQ (UPF0313 family)